MIVSIHQPNFFPWLGYFDKIIKSDVFIFLDDVQFQKKGGTWGNRVKLIIGQKEQWVTANINRKYSGVKPINEIFFVDKPIWEQRIIKTIHTNYSKHPFFSEVWPFIEDLILFAEDRMSDYNINTINRIIEKLKIKNTRIIKSSEINVTGYSNELLCSLTKEVGGSVYMAGGGADSYQDISVFESEKIGFCYQNFKHPQYPQRNQDIFIPGLSIIDAMMNLGFLKTRELLLS